MKFEIGTVETDKGEVNVNDNGNGRNNSSVLVSGKQRAELLKTGLTGKDIESLYLKFNEIIVIGINW